MNKCIACFNWSTGKIGPRVLNNGVIPSDCKSRLTKTVSNCKTYNSLLEITNTNVLLNHCDLCSGDGKLFLRYQEATAHAKCTAVNPGQFTIIENCLTTVTFESTSALRNSQGKIIIFKLFDIY